VILSTCVAGVGLLLGVWVVRTYYPFDGTSHLETFRFADARVIELRASVFCDNGCVIYYRVPGFIDRHAMGYTSESPGSLKFSVLTAEGGALVAVVEASAPEVVLLLHDFERNDSWPYQGHTEHHTERLARGEALLRRLVSEHPKSDCVLSHHVTGRTLRISG